MQMQKMEIFAIRDTKAEAFNPPFYQRTKAEAERSLQRLVLDPDSNVSKFPEDFDLYHLGTYNDSTGEISPLPSPEHIIKAINVLNRT